MQQSSDRDRRANRRARASRNPDDEGSVRTGTNLAPGYFDQHLGTLDPARTAVEEIRSVRGDFNVDVARAFASRATTRSAYEPINHLDIPACEIFEQALSTGYEGTLIVVSHDRQFLETVTNRLIVVRDGRAEVLPGGFRDHAGPRPVAHVRRSGTAARATSPPAPIRRTAEVPDTEDRREALELAIASAEAEIAAMRAELAADPGGDWAAIAQKAERERAASRKLESMLLEWTSLAGPAR